MVNVDTLSVSLRFLAMGRVGPPSSDRPTPEGFVRKRLEAGPLGRLPVELVVMVCKHLSEEEQVRMILAGAPKVETDVTFYRHIQGRRHEYSPRACDGFGSELSTEKVVITLGVMIQVTVAKDSTGVARYVPSRLVTTDEECIAKTIYKLNKRKLWYPCECPYGPDTLNNLYKYRCPECGRHTRGGSATMELLQRRLIRDL